MKKALCIAVLAFIGSWVWAQNIAVFPFEDMENVLTRNQAVMFYREFSNEFTNESAGKFSVVPRNEVDKLINFEMAFQLSDYSAKVKTAEMQKVLNANQILSGLIGRLDNNKIRIIVSLYTYPELRQLPGGTSLNVANTTELFDKIPELVQQMQDRIARGGTTQSIPEGLLYQIVDGRTMAITSYIGNAATVNIPSHILGLPVTSIGQWAFAYCYSLTSITIPSSVTSIGEHAFVWCTSLTSVTIPFSVTYIGDWAFSVCRRLTSITIPSSVTYIGDQAFSSCWWLASIMVDNRNPVYASIDGVLFDKNIRTLIQYPEGKNQKTYVIPSSVASIEISAFYRCGSLTSVTIPSSVTSIGDRAFSLCISLTSITIPSSVTSIGNDAFFSCESLTSITLDNRNPVYASIDGVLFDKNIRTLIQYPEGKNQKTYAIPSSVASIGYRAFCLCSSLTSVTIPSSVTSIGESAFSGCSSLISITIPNSVTSIGEWAFYEKRLTSITIGAYVDMYVDSFENGFPDFYYAQWRMAGTYTYRNGSWSVR